MCSVMKKFLDKVNKGFIFLTINNVKEIGFGSPELNMTQLDLMSVGGRDHHYLLHPLPSAGNLGIILFVSTW